MPYKKCKSKSNFPAFYKKKEEKRDAEDICLNAERYLTNLEANEQSAKRSLKIPSNKHRTNIKIRQINLATHLTTFTKTKKVCR